MARFRLRFPSPVVLSAIVIIVVAYIAMGIGLNLGVGQPALRALVLDPGAVLHGEAWRLVTYGFVHDPQNPLHVALNALMLYFFGRDLEDRFGRFKFALYLVVAVVVGGLFVMASSLLIHPSIAMGFSAAVEASIVTWALYNRNAQVLFLFAVPMRGIHMLWLAVAQWVLDAVSLSEISAAAHLGGIVFGAVVWFFGARRNRVRLFVDDVLAKLRLRKQPKLTVVPKKDRWVN